VEDDDVNQDGRLRKLENQPAASPATTGWSNQYDFQDIAYVRESCLQYIPDQCAEVLLWLDKWKTALLAEKPQSWEERRAIFDRLFPREPDTSPLYTVIIAALRKLLAKLRELARLEELASQGRAVT
jgi:hypothetical protein